MLKTRILSTFGLIITHKRKNKHPFYQILCIERTLRMRYTQYKERIGCEHKMKLFVFARPSLQLYLEKLLPTCPHEVDVSWLPEQTNADLHTMLQEQLAQAKGYDAVILADGGCLLPEDGLACPHAPLVIPRVHNAVSLLLGGAEPYRRLFDEFGGLVAWYHPGTKTELLDCPHAECVCLGYLADTQLMLADESIPARLIAQKNSWDFFNAECDYSLLTALLSGDWDDDKIAVVPKGEFAKLSYNKDIIE